ncbi:hypothetical protein C7M84_019422 [Penaeus vannamei]|uniref:Uncharacterized protein n=1 Tax=Penaeus vannamei TaxID=6689 RepID=A0A3R7P6Y8_PENVA|nr:hypothetical protein C7M84_019422 [Penaeus vannamei]
MTNCLRSCLSHLALTATLQLKKVRRPRKPVSFSVSFRRFSPVFCHRAAVLLPGARLPRLPSALVLPLLPGARAFLPGRSSAVPSWPLVRRPRLPRFLPGLPRLPSGRSSAAPSFLAARLPRLPSWPLVCRAFLPGRSLPRVFGRSLPTRPSFLAARLLRLPSWPLVCRAFFLPLVCRAFFLAARLPRFLLAARLHRLPPSSWPLVCRAFLPGRRLLCVVCLPSWPLVCRTFFLPSSAAPSFLASAAASFPLVCRAFLPGARLPFFWPLVCALPSWRSLPPSFLAARLRLSSWRSSAHLSFPGRSSAAPSSWRSSARFLRWPRLRAFLLALVFSSWPRLRFLPGASAAPSFLAVRACRSSAAPFFLAVVCPPSSWPLVCRAFLPGRCLLEDRLPFARRSPRQTLQRPIPLSLLPSLLFSFALPLFFIASGIRVTRRGPGARPSGTFSPNLRLAWHGRVKLTSTYPHLGFVNFLML